GASAPRHVRQTRRPGHVLSGADGQIDLPVGGGGRAALREAHVDRRRLVEERADIAGVEGRDRLALRPPGAGARGVGLLILLERDGADRVHARHHPDADAKGDDHLDEQAHCGCGPMTSGPDRTPPALRAWQSERCDRCEWLYDLEATYQAASSSLPAISDLRRLSILRRAAISASSFSTRSANSSLCLPLPDANAPNATPTSSPWRHWTCARNVSSCCGM